MTTWLSLASLLVSMVAAAGDATGTWALHFDPDFSGYPADATCTLKQDGRKLTGTCGGDAALVGSIERGRVRWTMKTGAKREWTVTFTGTIDESGATITGGWVLPDRADHRGKFTAQKAQKPSQ